MSSPKTSRLLCALALWFAPAIQADPVSYAAKLETSRLNPVTDVLILEADAEGTVHGTVYPEDLPGNGYAVIRHDPPFTPVRSLVIGLTEGEDAEGNDKTQLVMFLADDFAVDNQEVPFSDAFPGARHSLTIDSLQAAVAGDAAEMAWFTETFFSGPAAAAVFDTGGSFTVAEFTVLGTIGGAVTAGDWVLNLALVVLDPGDPDAENGTLTAVLDETATSAGPFDIEFELDDDGVFAVNKTVLNDSGVAWTGFTLEVGTGLGGNFLPTQDTNVRRFENPSNLTHDDSGAFPVVNFSQPLITFTGALAPGESAEFVFFVTTLVNGEHMTTVRQSAILAEAESRATFEVTKDFTDDNPDGVEVTISCNTGLPLQQSKVITEGAGVEFVVVDFDDGELDCEITEDNLAGYDVEYFDGSATSSTSCEFLDVGFESAFSCQITNSPAPVEVEITKDWVFEGTSTPQGVDQRYDLTLWCNAEIVDGEQVGDAQETPSGIIGPFCGLIALPLQEGGQGFGIDADWCKVFFGEGSDSFVAEVIPEFPDSHCFVIERLFDDAVEVDNGCQNITVSAGVGASCTITNTVFFEGIPTLNQYGLALLALLMLGVGFVGFRRFA
jgi:hypothetical protein